MSTGVIAVVQYATAATFVIIGLTAYQRGAEAQRAAEAEVVRQGFAREVLTRHQVRIEESLAELMLPLGIAAVLATMATLNLTTADTGRTMTWILQPILFVVAGFITGSQVFVHQSVAATFRKSEDADARAVDTRAVLDAAFAAFPRWLRSVVVARFALVTLGSVVVLALLALS